MASENAQHGTTQAPKLASENRTGVPAGRRGRAPAELSARHATILRSYTETLATAPLSAQTRRTYESKVRQYLAWLATAELDSDPLASTDGRDWAVRDYRTHLQTVLKRAPATVNNALAAIDDLYLRTGIGPANATRADLPTIAPRALDKRAAVRFLRAVESCHSPRDRALALTPFYAGTRIAETVALDIDDVRLSARKGILRVYGKREKVREIPLHAKLRDALTDWLQERQDWPGANTPALYLNQRGGRLSATGAHDIITTIAATAQPDDAITAHTLRHTFATRLVRGRTDLITVAELLGHARLETTRAYSRPSHEDRADALNLLDIDE
jgi:site-specific recombinase XerD